MNAKQLSLTVIHTTPAQLRAIAIILDSMWDEYEQAQYVFEQQHPPMEVRFVVDEDAKRNEEKLAKEDPCRAKK